MRYPVAIMALLLLGGCASAPKNTTNSCAIFREQSGFLTNWRGAAERTSAEFGVPVSVLMATIQAESNFEPRARPPRRQLLGFIPWKRQSTAYGYAQALNGTWSDYQSRTGRSLSRRNNFADAIHFVGWYHHQNHRQTGIALNDAYNLYLAYYSGPAGYARGSWKSDPAARRGARRAADMAARYEAQLRSC
ncbi:transglycosylase SLT domain-containing protein [Aureimonas mangrovi]|uniref:transglycosylase SLT domain-containing protein n=1 Tax=Aureimonas mangrovi TaxID=2758041 RepID=UPI00163DDC9A|nr:transglycosylase SLT domain-containing protein [Aureimonas mangrovi]